MIYPHTRSLILIALGAGVALAAGLWVEQGWVVGLFWAGGMVLAIAADGILAPSRRDLALEQIEPLVAHVGRESFIPMAVRFARAAPKRLEAALDCPQRLGLHRSIEAAPVQDKQGRFAFQIAPARRGDSPLERLTVRWTGPFGLTWKQKRFDPQQSVRVITDTIGLREEAVRIFSRNAMFGQKADILRGEGTEFQALREFQTGMDRRSIDWKQSARHLALLAKEYRVERNHHIIMALDCGRAMCEPVGNLPRIDRAISAALLLAFGCLRNGDRAGLFAFDARPRVNTGAVTGADAFRILSQKAGSIDYSSEETNYTFGLTTLGASLKRRSLIVVFTEFTDATAAELLLEGAASLLKRHLVLFVLLRDDELEALAGSEPQEPADVTRAIVADSLLKQREAVVHRLQRMGAHIVEAPADSMGAAALNGYLDLKRRDLL
jgi:uncharacterized protein (DUF58 family)